MRSQPKRNLDQSLDVEDKRNIEIEKIGVNLLECEEKGGVTLLKDGVILTVQFDKGSAETGLLPLLQEEGLT